jgi:hypothetical protein
VTLEFKVKVNDCTYALSSLNYVVILSLFNNNHCSYEEGKQMAVTAKNSLSYEAVERFLSFSRNCKLLC